MSPSPILAPQATECIQNRRVHLFLPLIASILWRRHEAPESLADRRTVVRIRRITNESLLIPTRRPFSADHRTVVRNCRISNNLFLFLPDVRSVPTAEPLCESAKPQLHGWNGSKGWMGPHCTGRECTSACSHRHAVGSGSPAEPARPRFSRNRRLVVLAVAIV